MDRWKGGGSGDKNEGREFELKQRGAAVDS